MQYQINEPSHKSKQCQKVNIICPFTKCRGPRNESKNKLRQIKTNQLKSFKCKKNNGGPNRNKNSYVVCKYQIKSARYIKLKITAANAHKENKIFSIYGNCKVIRDALLERGWVEKIQPNRINLSKVNNNISDKKETHLESILLSSFLSKFHPNFIWYSREETRKVNIDAENIENSNTVINKIVPDAIWTSKQGLCSTIKKKYWFYIQDVAEVHNPRSYDVSDVTEVPHFEKDYKITACTSLLKWVILMTNNKKAIFTEIGEISLNLILFALNRCKEYIYRKQNKDIDHTIRTISNNKWNSFLKDYHLIISGQEVFRLDGNNKSKLYVTYAKCFLREMLKYRPQLSCEGCHNIWIIKPAHCSRGRGIKMASKLPEIRNIFNVASTKYVIQKYIEEPLLIHDTKFDIRQYYLITSTYPLVIWMYRDCYLKFSSQKYNLKNYNESIHLTNNAIQRKYSNSKGRHVDLPQNNMWALDKFKDYLKSIEEKDVWNDIVYPGMKKSIVNVMLCCQDSLSVSKNRFELYGCDFLLDEEYKPWLIEINSCPDLNNTTQVTAKICPAVLSDIIKVVIDYSEDPSVSTGQFECIYRQPITTPKYGNAVLTVRGFSLPDEYFYRDSIERNDISDDIITPK